MMLCLETDEVRLLSAQIKENTVDEQWSWLRGNTTASFIMLCFYSVEACDIFWELNLNKKNQCLSFGFMN